MRHRRATGAWWADWRVVYPDAARAALAAVPNFVRVGGGVLPEGFAEEMRLVGDSGDARAPEVGRVYVTNAWDRMRVVAGSEEGPEARGCDGFWNSIVEALRGPT